MDNTKARLWVADGNYHMHRAKHGFSRRPLTNSDGDDVTIVYGVLQQMGSELEQFKPTHTCAVFDGENASETRRKIYPEYKANRDDNKDEGMDGQDINFLQQQFWIRALLLAMGFHVACTAYVEGDDMLGSAVHLFSPEAKIIVSTRDKDMMALVKRGVRIYDGNTKKMFDLETVFDHYGVRPDQMVDLLCLLGDTVDNIPGCPGMGPVFACELLAEFDSVDNFIREAIILSKSGKLSKRFLRIFTMVMPWYENPKGYRMAHKLITLITYNLETEGRPVELSDWRIRPPSPELPKLMEKIGIRKLHTYFQMHTTGIGTKPLFGVKRKRTL